MSVEMPSWLFSKYPITCTMCDGSFEHKGKRIIYPYPMKEYLCFTCFKEAMDTGLGRLNKSLRGEALTEEDFKPHSRSQFVQTCSEEANPIKIKIPKWCRSRDVVRIYFPKKFNGGGWTEQ